MTNRLPAFAYAGSPCFAELREFLDSWGGQLAAGVLPGIIMIAPLLFGPKELVLLGPTVVTVTVMALLFTLALPYHSFRQFQALRDGGAGAESSQPIGEADGEVPWSVAGVDGWKAPRPSFRRRPRSPRVAALEKSLLERAGLRPPSWAAATHSSAEGPELRAAFMTEADKMALEQAYADLALPPGASLQEVRRSYRRHMRVFHPDQHREDRRTHQLTGELARELAAAYSTISNALQRG